MGTIEPPRGRQGKSLWKSGPSGAAGRAAFRGREQGSPVERNHHDNSLRLRNPPVKVTTRGDKEG